MKSQFSGFKVFLIVIFFSLNNEIRHPLEIPIFLKLGSKCERKRVKIFNNYMTKTWHLIQISTLHPGVSTVLEILSVKDSELSSWNYSPLLNVIPLGSIMRFHHPDGDLTVNFNLHGEKNLWMNAENWNKSCQTR